MSDASLNPDHEVSKWAEDNWQKLIAMIMFKAGVTEVHITPEDVHAYHLAHPGSAVVVDALTTEIVIELVTMAEAQARVIVG